MKKLLGAGMIAALGFAAAVGMTSNAAAEQTRSMNGGGPSVSWCDTNINGGGSLCGTLAPYLGSLGFRLSATSTSGWWFMAAQYHCTASSQLRGYTSPNRYSGSAAVSIRCPYGTGNLGTVVGLLEDL